MVTQRRSGVEQSEGSALVSSRRKSFEQTKDYKNIFALRMVPASVEIAMVEDYYYKRIKNDDGTPGMLVALGAKIGQHIESHPTSVADPLAIIRSGVKIGENCMILGHTRIGFNTKLGNGVEIEDAEVGDNVILEDGVLVDGDDMDGMTIGHGTIVKARAEIYNANIGDSAVIGEDAIIDGKVQGIDVAKDVVVGARSRIEQGARIKKGVRLAEGARVEEGVVIEKIEAGVVPEEEKKE